MSKFKAGDKVVVAYIDEGDEKYYNVGSVGVVEDVVCDRKICDVLFEDGNLWSVTTKQIELYKEEKETDPAKIAPLLWNAYKDILNEEDLANLKDVIVNQRDSCRFDDASNIQFAFTWTRTKQGHDYWANIYNTIKEGTYNKPVSVAVENCAKPNIDKHYNFMYSFSLDDQENGHMRIDPYFVAKQWQLGKKDDSGVLFHCLKTIARYGDKNPIEREIKALHLQVKRLAELNNVELD